MEGGAVGHNFERDPPRDHPCQVWFNLVQRFQNNLNVKLKCSLVNSWDFSDAILTNTFNGLLTLFMLISLLTYIVYIS